MRLPDGDEIPDPPSDPQARRDWAIIYHTRLYGMGRVRLAEYLKQLEATQPVCASCGTGPMPKTSLAGKPPQLRQYRVITEWQNDEVMNDREIVLHDNCLIEYMEANPSHALSRSL